MDDLKLKEMPETAKTNLIDRAARYGAFGWFAFFLMLVLFAAQNLIYALKPPYTLAVEDGKIIGQISYNETQIRSNDDVLSDVKMWVSRCISINKNTIFDDLGTCLTHMDSALSEKTLTLYKETNYANIVSTTGCIKSDTTMDVKESLITYRNRETGIIEAKIKGYVSCMDKSDDPATQPFYVKVSGKLVQRNANHPLAIEVSEYADI